ncbi:MAG: ABC transporter ATP-binding protein [Sporolactobacillus sp.]
MDIGIKHVDKMFADTPVLTDVTVNIQHLQLTAILGPSGCGKTTLLRVLAGLERPDNGEIMFDQTCMYSSERGIDIPLHRRAVGMVFQDFALWPHMSVFENTAFPLRAARQKKNVRERVLAALAKVQLSGLEQRYPQELSGGQQQRVAIARAIIGKPDLLLFDEPFSSLDARLRDDMRIELIRLISDLHMTTVFVTHDQSEAMSMADQLIILQNGRVLQTGTPEAIYRHPADHFVANFLGYCNVLPDRTHMLHPEQVMTAELAQAKVAGTVRACLYLGERYELRVWIETGEWRLFSLRQYAVGETIGLTFREQDKIPI